MTSTRNGYPTPEDIHLFGASWPGDLSLGIAGPIDRQFVENWIVRHLTHQDPFPTDWRLDLVFAWRRHAVKSRHSSTTSNGEQLSDAQLIFLQKRQQHLEEEMAKLKKNRVNQVWSSDPTIIAEAEAKCRENRRLYDSMKTEHKAIAEKLAQFSRQLLGLA
jgi:hypothetical protein